MLYGVFDPSLSTQTAPLAPEVLSRDLQTFAHHGIYLGSALAIYMQHPNWEHCAAERAEVPAGLHARAEEFRDGIIDTATGREWICELSHQAFELLARSQAN